MTDRELSRMATLIENRDAEALARLRGMDGIHGSPHLADTARSADTTILLRSTMTFYEEVAFSVAAAMYLFSVEKLIMVTFG